MDFSDSQRNGLIYAIAEIILKRNSIYDAELREFMDCADQYEYLKRFAKKCGACDVIDLFLKGYVTLYTNKIGYYVTAATFTSASQ
jgi:ABC-type multidrug transport system fused ATPase/permease subunit